MNDDPNLIMQVGEMKGQLRELIHQNANMSMKIDAIAREIAQHSTLPAIVAENRTKIAALEAKQSRQDGAMSFGEWLMRSNLVTWVVMAVGVIWAAVTGKLQ